MSDIPDTKYITINKDGIFVGGKTVRFYQGKGIGFVDDAKKNFAKIQSEHPEIKELHIGAFKTKGEYANVGNPTEEFGPNAWCRVKLFDDRLGPWVFYKTYASNYACVRNCVYDSGYNFRYYYIMRSSLLNFSSRDFVQKTR